MAWSESRTFSITPCMLPLEVLPYSTTQHGSTSQVVWWGILPEDLGGGQALTTLCRSDTETYKAKARQESPVYCTQIAHRDCFKGCKQGTERQSETSLLPCVEVRHLSCHVWSDSRGSHFTILTFAGHLKLFLSIPSRAPAKQLHTLLAPKSDERLAWEALRQDLPYTDKIKPFT